MYEMYVTSERKGANLSNQIGDQYNRVVHETKLTKASNNIQIQCKHARSCKSTHSVRLKRHKLLHKFNFV